jgi:hypothetical protein
MKSFPKLAWSPKQWLSLAAFVIAAPITFASSGDRLPETASRNLVRATAGTRIECTAPDGHVLEMVTVNDRDSINDVSVATLNDDTVSCPLPKGQTTLVIKLPKDALLDRFSFVNENAAAEGELKISISTEHLTANSPKWVDVEGVTSFTNKRLVDLLMVGVEAHYVKLTFNVAKAGRIASLGLYGGDAIQRLAWR